MFLRLASKAILIGTLLASVRTGPEFYSSVAVYWWLLVASGEAHLIIVSFHFFHHCHFDSLLSFWARWARIRSVFYFNSKGWLLLSSNGNWCSRTEDKGWASIGYPFRQWNGYPFRQWTSASSLKRSIRESELVVDTSTSANDIESQRYQISDEPEIAQRILAL